MTFYITNAVAILALDAIVDTVDDGAGAGVCRIYSGSVPADADDALGGATQLVEITLNDPAFAGSTDATGSAQAALDVTPTPEGTASASGTASFFRILDSNGVVKFQGAVATSGSDMNISNTSIVASGVVRITSGTVTLPESV